MAAPVPARESVTLHNKLVDLSYEQDLKEIERIKWRLQSLVRKRPNDAIAAVALIEACRKSGSREEAVEQVDRVWRQHASFETRVLENYETDLVHLGLYDRAKEVFEQIVSSRGLEPGSSLMIVATCAAVVSGDLAWLKQLNLVTEVNKAALYLKLIEGTGLTNHFGPHQKIVHDIVGGLQCHVSVAEQRDVDEPEDLPGMFTYFFVPASRMVRRGLEQEIREALERYYVNQGLAPGVYIGHFQTTLVSVPFPER